MVKDMEVRIEPASYYDVDIENVDYCINLNGISITLKTAKELSKKLSEAIEEYERAMLTADSILEHGK